MRGWAIRSFRRGRGCGQWVAKGGATRENARSHSIHSRNSGMISVTINGERRQFEGPLNVAQLITGLSSGQARRVERNGEIVPRSRYAEQPLQKATARIVVAVGGG